MMYVKKNNMLNIFLRYIYIYVTYYNSTVVYSGETSLLSNGSLTFCRLASSTVCSFPQMGVTWWQVLGRNTDLGDGGSTNKPEITSVSYLSTVLLNKYMYILTVDLCVIE